VHGARVNNLKDVTIEIPERRLTVFTGVSGSGKSSLVFDTIAAESQRLINETYSAFVQGFMPTMARPEVDLLGGLTTAIIVDQQPMSGHPRSTVGTATDAGTLLRILFSRLARPYIGSQKAFAFNVATADASGHADGGLEDHREGLQCRRRHVPALRGHGRRYRHRSHPALRRRPVARRGRGHRPRLETRGLGSPVVHRVGLLRPPQGDPRLHRPGDARPPAPEPVKVKVINTAYEGLLARVRNSFLAKDRESLQPHIRAFVDRTVTFGTCPECDGTRLTALTRSSKIDGVNIADACAMQISELAAWVRGLDDPSVATLVSVLGQTLDAFVDIGLGYLSLDRPSGTLSGGEAQRTKMIRHLGSALTDVTYVFDEPTVGLHPHDIQRMNDLLVRLRDKGNTVLVVEHKPETIRIADHVVDLGPKAGAEVARWSLRARSTGCAPVGPSPDGTSTTGSVSSRRCAPRRASSRCVVPTPTTCATSMSTSRSGCSPCSPGWRAPARAR
jgi:energy-coupling factor transporter ATP-binding protein EcfA2